MKFKQARQLAGMTQVGLAEEAGIPQSHVSNLEQGKFFPQKETREKIEKALGMEIDWIGTRLDGDRKLNFVPDGQVASEAHVMASIANFIKTGHRKDIPGKIKFIRDFIDQYEKKLFEENKK